MNKIAVKPISDYVNDDLLIRTIIHKDVREYPIGKMVEEVSVKIIELYHLQDTVSDFEHLEQNWDSYNANPISTIARERAMEVISQLINDNIYSKITDIEVSLFPMRDGGIQFEFDSDSVCSELEINPDGQLLLLQFDTEGNIKNRIPIYELSKLTSSLEEK